MPKSKKKGGFLEAGLLAAAIAAIVTIVVVFVGAKGVSPLAQVGNIEKYGSASWACQDGTQHQKDGGCVSPEEWLKEAERVCYGLCSNSGKCGIGTFAVGKSCVTGELPVCGNNMCDKGESDTFDTGDCDRNAEPSCVGPALRNKGSCASDCPVHLFCYKNACAWTTGPGNNECTKHADCGDGTHLECVNKSCQTVRGPGRNFCSTNPDTCTAHTVCQVSPFGGSQCVVVTGKGDSQCRSDADCAPNTRRYDGASWTCQDGTQGKGDDVCLSAGEWQKKAETACEGRCAGGYLFVKCGVASFSVGRECTSRGPNSSCPQILCAPPPPGCKYGPSLPSSEGCKIGCGALQCESDVGLGCGDGRTDPGEQCDDGNTISWDGCSDLCRIELSEDAYSAEIPSIPPPAGFENEVRVAPLAPVFSDIKSGPEVAAAAQALAARGVIGGYPDGTFREERPVNRAELAKFLLLANGSPVPERANEGRFRDVLEGEWYVKFVMEAAMQGIIDGYPDGTFRPANTVNVAEFLKMTTRTFSLPENIPYTYADVTSQDWFSPYVGLAERFDLFGRSNTLNPAHLLTRGEVAVALEKALTILK